MSLLGSTMELVPQERLDPLFKKFVLKARVALALAVASLPLGLWADWRWLVILPFTAGYGFFEAWVASGVRAEAVRRVKEATVSR